MALVTSTNLISPSQRVPADVSANRFDIQHAFIPFGDVVACAGSVPNRPDVTEAHLFVMFAKLGVTIFVALESQKVPRVLMASILEGGKNDSNIDMDRTRMIVVFVVVLGCIAQCAPSNRQSIGFPAKEPLLISVPPQKLVSNSGNVSVPFPEIIAKIFVSSVI